MKVKGDAIRDGYVEFLRSRKFDPYFRKLVREPKWRYILAIPLILSLAGIGIGLGLVYSARKSVRKRNWIRQEMIAAARRSVPVVAYLLMANRMLMRQKGMVAPALAIATFEEDATDEEMIEIVERISMAEFEDLSDESKAVAAGLFEDEQFIEGRRRLLPLELTGGRRVYAIDLVIFNDFLPSDTLEDPLITCVAEPGNKGTIQMVPWWIADRAMQGV